MPRFAGSRKAMRCIRRKRRTNLVERTPDTREVCTSYGDAHRSKLKYIKYKTDDVRALVSLDVILAASKE